MDDSKSERPWKTLETKYLFRKPWLTARVDKLELPDGRIMPEYYVLEYPDWVNIIAITKDEKFVMERQYRHAAEITAYELPCGVIEKGESPLEAAKRELAEETGYGGGEWRELMQISPNPGAMTNMTHCFVATGVEKVSEQHFDEHECLTVHLLERDEVRQLMGENRMFQSLMLAPLWRYFSEQDRNPPTGFRPMRRAKQALSQEESLTVLKNVKRGVLSMIGDGGWPYGVYMNPYYNEADGRIYFHSSKIGHRVKSLKRDPRVSFTVIDDGIHETDREPAWAWTFRSVIVFGRVEFVEDREKALEICRDLMRRFTKDEPYIEDEIRKSGAAVQVFALVPEHITGKRVHEA